MNQPTATHSSIALDAIAAGRLADAHAACRAAQDTGEAPPWLTLAAACHKSGDADGEEAALQAQIRVRRDDLAALAAMAELKRRQRDDRAAGSFYRRVQAILAGQPSLPPQLAALAQRTQEFLAASADRYARHLTDDLAAQNVSLTDAGPRMRHALDLLTGRASLFLQQPSMFYFPGLAQRAWFEREEFAWAGAIEDQTDVIAYELDQLAAGPDEDFAPYIQAEPGRPAPANPLLDDPSWGAAYLWKSGVRHAPVADRCPLTMAALAGAPMPDIAARSPMALFSRLTPGTHIAPHVGLLNTRLIVHLPLVVPDGCAMRVGAETRPWTCGKLTIFDDSFDHEAWNGGTSDRTILLFEIWRPDIDPDERRALTALFTAIDRYASPADPE